MGSKLLKGSTSAIFIANAKPLLRGTRILLVMRYCFLLCSIIGLLCSSLGVAQEYSDALSQARKAYDSGDYQQTLTILASSETPAPGFDVLLLKADALQKQQAYSKAIELYNRAEKLNSSNADLYINRASAYIWSKDYKSAFGDLEKADKMDPKNYRIHYYEGVAYYYEYKNKKAIKALDACIANNQTYAPAYYLRAACLGEANQINAAIDDYNRAYKLDEGLTEALFNIAVLKYLNKDYYSAGKDFDKLLEADFSKQSEVFYYRAECAYYQNDKQEACLNYAKAAKEGDELAAEIYDKYCLKGVNRKTLPERSIESISL